MMRRCPPSRRRQHTCFAYVLIPPSRRRRPLQTKTQVQPTDKAKNIYFIPSAHGLNSRPPCTFSGRADNACTNLLGSLARYVRTRGIVEVAESAKLPTCTISPLPHALATHYFLRLTRARGGCFLRGRKALLNDFCRAFGHSKAREKKSFFKVSSRETNGLPYNLNPSTSINKQPAPHNAYIEKHLVFAEKFPQKILLPAVKSFRRGTEVLI